MTRSTRSRPTAIATTVAALALLAGAPSAPAAGARVAPAVQAALDGAAAGDMLDVLVVLEDQADLRTAPGAGRAARLTAVLRRLRATATAGQRDLLALLARRRAQGQVASVRPFWIFDGMEIVASPGVIAEVARRADVAEVRSNETVAAPAADVAAAGPEWNVDRVGAPALWSLGITGQGAVVANMDTGVDVTHPDLSASWRGGSNSWYDPNGEHPSTPTDVSGHGTWTMGAMVGGSAGGTAVGVAPGARWIAVKIFNDHGSATTARIHSGFQWLLDPDHNPATPDAPNVVNDSWTLANPGCSLEFQLDLRALRSGGVVPVFAAGNGGPFAGSSLSPANNPEAVAIGGTDRNDALDPSSSRGPSACSQPVYPQLVAPGVDVRTTDLYGGYLLATGTSMAAPHAAGVLALLASALPGASADRQESALESSALDLGAPGPDNDTGYGRLAALAAYDWLRTAPDFSVQAAPGSASTLAGGSVTYSLSVTPANGFAGDVALSLTGLSPAQASWTFAPATVPGGTGGSQLSVATAAGLAPGTYPLAIRATSGALTRSAFVNLVVVPPPDFTLKASPTSLTTTPGGAVTSTITVGSKYGFAGDVTLSLSGLSLAQAGWTFTPMTVTGAGTSQLRITTAAGIAPGRYPLTVTGTSGALTHSVALTLTVSAPPDFTLAVSPSSVTVYAGQTASYSVSVGSVGGFKNAVSLSAAGLPSGATATFSPVAPVPPSTSALAVRTSYSGPRGTFTVRVTGTSGALTHQATTTLVVR